MSHTILLVQKTQAPSSKTYIECSSVATAMDEIISMYEEQLKVLKKGVLNKYPHKERIEFDVNEVLDMVFHLPDCAALVFDQKTSTYIPHDKSWIQKQVVVRAQSRAR